VLREVPAIAAIAAGSALPEQWGTVAAEVDFFDVRADLDALLRAGGDAQRFTLCPARIPPCTRPGRAYPARRTAVGWIGRLHPEVEQRLGLTYSAIVFELETESGLAAAVPAFTEIFALSRRASRHRGGGVEAVAVGTLLDCVRRSAGTLLRISSCSTSIAGRGIADGCKSVALGLNLQDVSRTLTDGDTDAVVARVVADLGREHSATIRINNDGIDESGDRGSAVQSARAQQARGARARGPVL